MPCLASFFDAMSGVKKLPNSIASITRLTSAFEPSLMNKILKTIVKNFGRDHRQTHAVVAMGRYNKPG